MGFESAGAVPIWHPEVLGSMRYLPIGLQYINNIGPTACYLEQYSYASMYEDSSSKSNAWHILLCCGCWQSLQTWNVRTSWVRPPNAWMPPPFPWGSKCIYLRPQSKLFSEYACRSLDRSWCRTLQNNCSLMPSSFKGSVAEHPLSHGRAMLPRPGAALGAYILSHGLYSWQPPYLHSSHIPKNT